MKKLFCAIAGVVIFANVYATSVVFDTSAILNKFKMSAFWVVITGGDCRDCIRIRPTSIKHSPTVTKTLSDSEISDDTPGNLSFITHGVTLNGREVKITRSDCRVFLPDYSDSVVVLSASQIGDNLYRINCVQQFHKR